MLITSLIVGALAVARLTRLLVSDKLTVGFRQWVIRRWGPDSKASVLVHCPWCISVWVALPVMPVAALFPNKWIIAVLAIPAAAYVVGFLANREDD